MFTLKWKHIGWILITLTKLPIHKVKTCLLQSSGGILKLNQKYNISKAFPKELAHQGYSYLVIKILLEWRPDLSRVEMYWRMDIGNHIDSGWNPDFLGLSQQKHWYNLGNISWQMITQGEITKATCHTQRDCLALHESMHFLHCSQLSN